MAKQYVEGSFGAYFVGLIKAHNYSQAKFATDLGVSKTYLFDVFNGRVKPPTPDMQDRIVELLHGAWEAGEGRCPLAGTL